MHIHTVKQGETIYTIAKDYDTTPAKICENNGIENKNQLSVGRELLILRPTRTYTVKRGDTLSGIAMRFGIKLRDLIRENPSHIGNDKLSVGEVLSVRCDKRKYGTSVSNGYFYQGCSEEKLLITLPFLTYVTIASVLSDDEGMRFLFNDRDIIKTVKSSGKIPLLRIYEVGSEEKYTDPDKSKDFIEKIIELARSEGYCGIVLCAFGAAERAPREFAEFVMALRRKMIGCDLVLFTEIDENSDPSVADVSDGSIFIYDNLMLEEAPSFDMGLHKILSEFASRCESSKVFIDIPSLAFDYGKYISYSDAMKLCYKKGCEIITDPSSLISHFDYKCGSDMHNVRFDSMKSTEAKLDSASELGFMGISFDISRTPISTLMMYGALYKILSGQVCCSDI